MLPFWFYWAPLVNDPKAGVEERLELNVVWLKKTNNQLVLLSSETNPFSVDKFFK